LTTAHHTQSDILAILQRDHERFTSLINRLSQEELQKSFTPEGWSIKDFLAHMTHWKKATHALVVAYLHDQPLPSVVPSGDTANEEQRQHDTGASLQDALADWKETHTHLQHIVLDELDTQRLMEKIRVPWDKEDTAPIGTLIADMCEHDTEHFDLIEQHFTSSK